MTLTRTARALCLLVVGALVSGCTGSSRPSSTAPASSASSPSSPSSTATSSASTGPTTIGSCRWGASALRTTNRVLVLSNSAYELIDTTTLRVLRRCEGGPGTSWTLPALAAQYLTYRRSKPVLSQ